MRHGASVDRACPWWLALAAVAVSLVWFGAIGVAAVDAQPCVPGQVCPDHLKCQFARRAMLLGNAQLLCAPARKLIPTASQD